RDCPDRPLLRLTLCSRSCIWRVTRSSRSSGRTGGLQAVESRQYTAVAVPLRLCLCPGEPRQTWFAIRGKNRLVTCDQAVTIARPASVGFVMATLSVPSQRFAVNPVRPGRGRRGGSRRLPGGGWRVSPPFFPPPPLLFFPKPSLLRFCPAPSRSQAILHLLIVMIHSWCLHNGAPAFRIILLED